MCYFYYTWPEKVAFFLSILNSSLARVLHTNHDSFQVILLKEAIWIFFFFYNIWTVITLKHQHRPKVDIQFVDGFSLAGVFIFFFDLLHMIKYITPITTTSSYFSSLRYLCHRMNQFYNSLLSKYHNWYSEDSTVWLQGLIKKYPTKKEQPWS